MRNDRNSHRRPSRLRVLLFPLEFATWKRACHWTYTAQLGLEEGFAANNVEFFTIPVIQEVPASSPASWLYYARQLCKDKRFDQVWLWLVHPQYDEEFLKWVEDVAPVRVGFSMESLEYSKQELEDHPHLNGRKQLVENQMRHMTHILACDEADAERINRQGLCKAWWFHTAVPEKFLAASPVVHQGKAVFCGSVYRGRDNWLKHRNLQSLLANAVSKEHYTQYPRLFDEINRKCMNFLQQNRMADEAFLVDYLNILRRIRRECFKLWLSGLQTGCAIVNLPHLFKSYAGRVVEAMAAGQPVISWQIPNRPRTSALFENGKEILLFDQSKPEQLANHIQHLQNDPDFARRMAENALRKVTGFHTVEKRVRQVLDWIETGTEPAFGETQQQRESSREPQEITESADEVEIRVSNQAKLADYGLAAPAGDTAAESGDAQADHIS
jgi:hypothetical protein